MGGLIEGAIDWRAPWLASLRPLQALLDAADWRGALTQAARVHGVVSGADRPITFVEGDAAGDTPYEAFIAATGRVPTRDNLHDRFNALMWLAWPATKAALNARQAAELARDGVRPRRGPVRDAATLIDENAVVVQCSDRAVFDALAAHDWSRALVANRAQWGGAIRVWPFGHALLEKLCRPFKGITACVVPLDGEGDADLLAAAFVRGAGLAPARLAALPVLGIPGWCSDNADSRFYDDPQVFRAPRAETALSLPHAARLHR